MAESPCHCCKKITEDHRLVSCSVCKNGFNIDCVDVSSTEARRLRTKSGLKWNCSSCLSLGNDIDSLRSIIINLQKDITELKESQKEVKISQSLSLMTENIIGT